MGRETASDYLPSPFSTGLRIRYVLYKHSTVYDSIFSLM